jgi:DNA-binding response OmpR family regulator
MDDNARILVVDDERELCAALCDILEREGYDAECAYDGATALEKVGQCLPASPCGTAHAHGCTHLPPYQLVLTDIRMPGIDGLELVRLLSERHSQVVTIVMTAYSSLQYALRAVECGAYGYLTKPFQRAEIVLAVQRGLARYREIGLHDPDCSAQLPSRATHQVSHRSRGGA